MKAIRKITTKIAGLALATVMLFGGASVFAAENYDVVYTNTLYATAERDNIFEEFTYRAGWATMTVPETGNYKIYVSSDHDNHSYKEFTAFGNGNVVANESGNWRGTTFWNVHLEEGVEYTISAYASHFMRVTFANDGIAKFYVEVTLLQKEETEIVPEMPGTPDFPEMPEVPEMPDVPEDTEEPEIPDIPPMPQDPEIPTSGVVPENPDEPEEAAAPAAQPTSSARPAVRSLTAAELRTLAVRNFVGHLYIDGLGRRATESEITEWTDKLMVGSITATEAACQILTSSEMNEYDFDNEQIASILDSVFGTDSEDDTLAQLNNGASVASVIGQLSGTEDWASKCAFYGVNV